MSSRGGTAPHGHQEGLTAGRDRRPPRWVRVVAVGALAGAASSVVVEEVLGRLARRAVDHGADPFLAVLVVGPFVLAVVLTTVLGSSVAAWVALRLWRVPRALVVAGAAGAVMAGAAGALVYNGVGDVGTWECAVASAVVHGGAWLVVGRREP